MERIKLVPGQYLDRRKLTGAGLNKPLASLFCRSRPRNGGSELDSASQIGLTIRKTRYLLWAAKGGIGASPETSALPLGFQTAPDW